MPRHDARGSGRAACPCWVTTSNASKLIVNEEEAVRIRTIFEWYLRHQGLIPVVQELQRCGWVNKRWVTRKGHLRGGTPFTKTSLHQLLTNVTYAGKVKHKQEVYPGEHAAIVDPEMWEKVQSVLRQNNRNADKAARNKQGALLQGLLHCVPCGCAMTPTSLSRWMTTLIDPTTTAGH